MPAAAAPLPAVGDRPFPALSPAQRFHLDAYGYVVLERLLDAGAAYHSTASWAIFQRK